MPTMMTQTKPVTAQSKKKKEKKYNKTWEAMMQWQGAFTIVDSTFLK